MKIKEAPVYRRPYYQTKADKEKEEKQKRIKAVLSDGIWRPVVYNGCKTTYMACTDGRIFNLLNAQIVNGSHNAAGYLKVEINYISPDGRKSVKVGKHRIIAQTFIPNPENKPEVNHINKIHDDNRVENLEWVTRSENSLHGHGTTTTRSSQLLIHKLPELFVTFTQRPEISVDQIADHYGYQYDLICRIQEIAFYLNREGRLPLDGKADMKWTPLNLNGEISYRYKISPFGLVLNGNNILTPSRSVDGYYKLQLRTNNDTLFKSTVSRLVACTFIPNPLNKPQVNHKDGNKLHEWVDNLEWVTASENSKHRHDTGISSAMRGETNGRSIYTEEQIRKACEMMANALPPIYIEEKTGVKRIDQYKLKDGSNWKHITNDYTFPDGRFTNSGKFIDADGNITDHSDKINSDFRKISKYPDEALHKACKLMMETDLVLTDIAKMTGISYDVLNMMFRHRAYMHVAGQYNFDSSKARCNQGEKNNNSMLTNDQVRKACEMMVACYPPKTITEKTGVSKAIQSDIRLGKAWRSIAKDYVFPKGKFTNHGKWIGEDGKVICHENTMKNTQFNVSKHSEDTIRNVCELLASGEYQVSEIMEKTGVSRSTIESIKSRKTFGYISKDYDFPRVIFTTKGRIVRWKDGREKLVPLTTNAK